jgi:hypothetical protein
MSQTDSSNVVVDLLPFSQAARANFFYELPRFVVEKLSLPFGARLIRMGVHGEGSCAFHSMCAALNIDEYMHRSVKDQFYIAHKFRCQFRDSFDIRTYTEYRKKLPNYTKSFDTVNEELCDPSAWADEMTINHAARTLQANILFLDIAKNKFYCGVHDKEVLFDSLHDNSHVNTSPTIIVHWCNHSHFEPIGRILTVGKLKTKIQLIFRPHEKKEDAEIVNGLMKMYKDECRAAV